MKLSKYEREFNHFLSQDYKVRKDLRHLAICSVDPPGCTDIDDALHWKILDNGNYEVKSEHQ